MDSNKLVLFILGLGFQFYSTSAAIAITAEGYKNKNTTLRLILAGGGKYPGEGYYLLDGHLSAGDGLYSQAYEMNEVVSTTDYDNKITYMGCSKTSGGHCDIAWSFRATNSSYLIYKVDIKLDYAIYGDSGNVNFTVYAGHEYYPNLVCKEYVDDDVDINDEVEYFLKNYEQRECFATSKIIPDDYLRVTANITSGTGYQGWEKMQLLREDFSYKRRDYGNRYSHYKMPLEITVYVEEKRVLREQYKNNKGAIFDRINENPQFQKFKETEKFAKFKKKEKFAEIQSKL